jgi:hypothetical protein
MILVKIKTGELPDDIPAKMDGGFGGGHACDACDEQISVTQAEYDFELPRGRVIRLHVGCSGVWQAEVLKRQVERTA